MSRYAAVVVAVVVADAAKPLAVELHALHALDGDDVCRSLSAIEMPECSVSLLQTRVEKMRKIPITVEVVDGSDQASHAMNEMKDAITDLFSPDAESQEKGTDHKSKMTLKSTAIEKASNALEDVKHAFSKLLAQEENKVHDAQHKTDPHDSKQDQHHSKKDQHDIKQNDDVSLEQQSTQIGHISTFDAVSAEDFWNDAVDAKSSADAQQTPSKMMANSGAASDSFWDDDWKKASNVGSAARNYLQAALEEEHKASKNVLLNTQAGSSSFPRTMDRPRNWSDEDEESIATETDFETSDKQVVQSITGSSVAQNSKSVQKILGDVMLSPDDQEMFTLPHESDHHDKPKVALESLESIVVGSEGTQDSSVLNSSWPWSRSAKLNVTDERVIKKDSLNDTKTDDTVSANATSSVNDTKTEGAVSAKVKASVNDAKTDKAVSAKSTASVNSTNEATQGGMTNGSNTRINASKDESSKIGLNKTEDRSQKTNVTSKSALMLESSSNLTATAPLVKMTPNMTSELKPVESAKNGTEVVFASGVGSILVGHNSTSGDN